MNDIPTELWYLHTQLTLALVAEALEKKRRISLEEQIALLIPTGSNEQKTITLANGAKVTAKRSLSYKADLAAIEKELKDFPVQAPVKSSTTRKLDEVGYEWYREHHPAVFLRIAKHVEVTPRKVAITLKPAKKGK